MTKELSSTDESEDDASQGINRSNFTAEAALLHSTMSPGLRRCVTSAVL